MLSISIGIMNLLPMPPLDGGQIAVALAEMVRGGKRLSLKVQNTAAMIGVTMVIALMVGALFVDMKRIVEAPQRDATVKKMLQDAATDNKAPAR
jgi:regulator of sigma E protease